MLVNRVRQAYKENRLSFGTYVGPSPRMVEMLGFAGLDFVRIDMAEAAMNVETVHNMIRTAHAVGVMPWVRVPPNNARLIEIALKMGALGVTMTRATCRADVEAAVRATKAPPVGERHAGPGGFSGGYGQMSYREHLEWANENVILSVQAETKSAVERIEEIVSVPGLDMVQSGRGDLSYEYGVPGQQHHPMVLEAEKKIVEAALKAGKMVALQHYPLRDPAQIDMVRDWIRQGVHCFCLGSDRDIVVVYRRLLEELKAQ